MPRAYPQDRDECRELPASPAIFEDDWIKMTGLHGWASCQPLNRYEALHRPLDHAGLFKKDDFKLYVLTHNTHASPVPGGRFVEMARFVSPWVEMEIGMCGSFLTSSMTKITEQLSRVDQYFDAAHARAAALEACGNPESKKVFWYGSYFIENCPNSGAKFDECGSFYINYPRVAGRNSTVENASDFVSFAVSFEANDPDYLPSKGDPELNEILKEATEIVRHTRYK